MILNRLQRERRELLIHYHVIFTSLLDVWKCVTFLTSLIQGIKKLDHRKQALVSIQISRIIVGSCSSFQMLLSARFDNCRVAMN